MTLTHAEHSHVAQVVPPRDLEASIGTARGMLRALAGEPITLEITGGTDGPRWYLRAASRAGLEQGLEQLRAAYPQARSEPLAEGQLELDPARLLAGERAVVVELGPGTDPALPLRSDWRHDPDPLAGLVAGITPEAGERVICRLTLGPAPDRAASGIRRRTAAAGRPGRDVPPPQGPSPLPIAGLLAVVVGGLQGWRWYEAGEWPLLVAGGIAAFVGIPLAAALAMRIGRRPEALPAPLVEQKLAAPLVAARLEIIAIGADARRLPLLAAGTAGRYAAYDDVAGGGLRPAAPRTPRPRARERLPLLLNTDELAGALAPPRPGRSAAPGPTHQRPAPRAGARPCDPRRTRRRIGCRGHPGCRSPARAAPSPQPADRGEDPARQVDAPPAHRRRGDGGNRLRRRRRRRWSWSTPTRTSPRRCSTPCPRSLPTARPTSTSGTSTGRSVSTSSTGSSFWTATARPSTSSR